MHCRLFLSSRLLTTYNTIVYRLWQSDLPAGLGEQLTAELTNQEQAVRFLAILEDLVALISSFVVQANTLQPETPLEDFTRRTLHLSEEEWRSTSPACVLQSQLCLAHLRALFTVTEELVSGNPLDKVLPGYQVPLLAEHIQVGLSATSFAYYRFSASFDSIDTDTDTVGT